MNDQAGPGIADDASQPHTGQWQLCATINLTDLTSYTVMDMLQGDQIPIHTPLIRKSYNQ